MEQDDVIFREREARKCQLTYFIFSYRKLTQLFLVKVVYKTSKDAFLGKYHLLTCKMDAKIKLIWSCFQDSLMSTMKTKGALADMVPEF